MASYIRFFPNGSDKAISLNELDEQICEAVGDEVHPKRWCRGWFDYIGWLLSCGRSYDYVRKQIEADEATSLIPVLDFLEANFRPDSWSGM